VDGVLGDASAAQIGASLGESSAVYAPYLNSFRHRSCLAMWGQMNCHGVDDRVDRRG
jgi:hypothetical protein